MDLRCPNGKLFGRVTKGVIEVSCQSRFCGKEAGLMIIHRISLETGETVETLKYQDPADRSENGHRNTSTTLRHEGRQADASWG